MADQIIVLTRADVRRPRLPVKRTFQVLFLYDLTASGVLPIQDNAGGTVVVATASGIGEPGLSYLTSGEKAAIASGTHGWELRLVDQLEQEDLQGLRLRLRRDLFPAFKSAWIAREQDARMQLGLRLTP